MKILSVFNILGRYIGAFIFVAFLFWMSGWVLSPDVSGKKAMPSAAEVGEVEKLRDLKIDKANPPTVFREVNYGEGPAGKWWPKGESPLLAELVKEGKLPPVAERVGSEPAVVEGIEGIGKYGGTWVRLATDASDALNLPANRMSYTSFLRFSTQGYPIVPHVARDYAVSEDSKEFTFYLRKGMRWSDGAPFGADDVAYWWDAEMSEPELTTEVPSVFRVRNVRCQVVKVDAHTVKFVFAHPYGMFPTLMATHLGAYALNSPQHYLEKFHPVRGDQELIARTMTKYSLPNKRAVYGFAKRTDNPERPHLWPWIYKTFRERDTQIFVRNPYYWMVDTAGNQLPYVDRVVYDAKGRQLLNIRAAERGGVTMQARHIDYKDYTNFMTQRKTGDYEVYHWYLADRSLFVIFPNLNRKVYDDDPGGAQKAELFNDVRFRQALSLAINRKDIIRAEYNNQAEPAQCMPGPSSYFYHEGAYKAFTEHDPARANALLDEMGLTKRDMEGYRLHRDGSRMTFYFDYCQFTGEGPVQFLVEDWAALGLRVVPRERSRQLWSTERAALKHDFDVWIGDCEYVPTLTARHVAPTVAGGSGFALGYTAWYNRGGLHDPSITYGVVPAPDHPLRKALEIYDHVLTLKTKEEQREAFMPLLDMAAKYLWSISINTPPPYLVIVENGFRNVPKMGVYSWVFQSPGNAGIETYFFDKNRDSAETQSEIKQEMSAIKPIPPVVKIKNDPTAKKRTGGDIFGSMAKYLVFGILVAFAVMLCLRHPFVLRRFILMVPTLAVVSVIVFTIVQLPPGDYLTSRIMQLRESGDAVNMQEIEDIEKMFWLKDPMPVRYLRWLGLYWFVTFDEQDTGLLQGNMGRSMENSRRVNDLIGERILLTFLITLGTIMFTWAVAIPIGIYSAVKQYSWGDYFFTFLGFIGMSFPGFLLALILSVAAGGITGLFSPEFAYVKGWSFAKFVDLLKHIWVPIVVTGVEGTAGMIRVMRGNLLDELRKPYVVTAMAKGVRPLRLLFKYPVRLALNPFISNIGAMLPHLVSGNAIVAIVLSLPTVGPLMLSALMSEDMYLAAPMLMVLSLLTMFGTLISDLLLLWVDPRIRFKGGSR